MRFQRSLWHFRDLVTDHTTGKLRETAVWSNIGKAAMVFGYVWEVVHGTMTYELTLVLGTVIFGHEGFSRMMNQKQQTMDKELPK